MDWEQLRERTLGEVGTSLVSEGVGTTAGFVGAAILGRQVQKYVKTDDAVNTDPTATNKFLAWGANNIPKIAAWYLLKRYTDVEPGEALTPIKEATVDAKKAVSGSVIYDTLIRLAHGGTNPGDVTLWGYQIMEQPQNQKAIQAQQADIQRLIQENSALRAELNKALQRLAAPAPAPVVAAPAPTPVVAAPAPVVAAPAPQVHVQPQAVVRATPAPVVNVQPQVRAAPAPAPVVNVQPQAPPVVRYQPVAQPQPIRSMPTPPVVTERQRKYGFMESDQTPPVVQDRQKKYGFMKAGEEKDIASMFGML
jgi:hypothetical protein